MYIVRVHTTKKNQVESIIVPKYINKEDKWPIEFRKFHATTNNYISKYFPILGFYSSITPFSHSSRL